MSEEGANREARSVSEALRIAVERTVAATAERAATTRARAQGLVDEAPASVRERAQELLDEVARRGQEAREQVARGGERTRRGLAGMRLATTEDIEAVAERIARLERRLERLEQLRNPEAASPALEHHPRPKG